MALGLASCLPPPSSWSHPLGDLLQLIHELPRGATGEMVIGDEQAPTGAIFVEENRVCWAAARGLGRRLIDLLARTASRPLNAEEVQDLYRRCRLAGVPFGETLVKEGMVTPDELRAAIRRHTFESCARMSTAPVHARWMPRAGAGYNPRFTYSTADLMTCAGELRDEARAQGAREELERVAGALTSAVAFARESGLAEPIPIAALHADTVAPGELGPIGRWAADALDVARVLSPKVRFHALCADDGRGALAWQRDAVTHVALPDDAGALSRALVALVRDESSGS